LPPSTDASPPSPPSTEVAARLARYRVPLGFALGAVALVLARPSGSSLVIGCLVAVGGEVIRLWAAGHVEKGREVTTSGPYRWTRHPLYIGSTVIGIGLAVATASVPVALMIGAYLAASFTAAIRTEEGELTAKFGDHYRNYRHGLTADTGRRFSLTRAWRNREQRAVAGLAAGTVLLALRWILRV